MVSDEEFNQDPYRSVYTRAVEALQGTMAPGWGPLATMWFAYDRLALVRTQSFVEVGGWDTMIPFYMTDCDMHERIWMKDYKIESEEVGKVWDVAGTLDDLEMLYKRGEASLVERDQDGIEKRKAPIVEKNSRAYQELLQKLDELQRAKAEKDDRNTWQGRQKGGEGEPFYRDSDGFEKALRMWMDLGRDVYAEKWGRGPCDIRHAGLKDGDEWRVVKDWEDPDVQRQYKKDREKEAKEKKEAADSGSNG